MKVRVISRNEEEFTRERKCDLQRLPRNKDPALHPFEKSREYVRALNSAKLDKIFAKPFVAALSGHSDAIFRLARHPHNLSTMVSGSCDGEIRVWNLASRSTVFTIQSAHSSFVRGLSVSADGRHFFSCGSDKIIKQWVFPSLEDVSKEPTPVKTFLGAHGFTDLDHRKGSASTIFATCGVGVDVWDHARSEPLHSLSWGCDSVITVRFNPIEPNTLISSGTDRAVALYDLRGAQPVRKVILQMKSNAIAWDPMEVMRFTVANEDHNLYTFDMRKLDVCANVHKDHVSAVMDVDYSPTGEEIVSGGYDRTIRIFPTKNVGAGEAGGRSKEIYHTKRMQRVLSVKYTSDSRYIISGSDDTNLRIWKAHAEAPVKVMVAREKQKLDYLHKVQERYQNVGEIKRIKRHKHVPKAIYSATRLKVEMKKSAKRKQDRVRTHSKPGAQGTQIIPERKKAVVTTKQ